jgi:hypothetical protein
MSLPLTAAANTPRVRRALTAKYTLPATLAIVIVGLVGWRAWEVYRPIQLPGAPASADAVEARWGIRISHIAVIAGGGLIDFRFQVIDPDKAAALFSLDTRPILYAEETGKMVDSLYHPPHSHNIVAGQSQYFLYNDRGGAIQRGTLVSIVLGDLRLEHIVAK